MCVILFVQEGSEVRVRHRVLSDHTEAFDRCPWVDVTALICLTYPAVKLMFLLKRLTPFLMLSTLA